LDVIGKTRCFKTHSNHSIVIPMKYATSYISKLITVIELHRYTQLIINLYILHNWPDCLITAQCQNRIKAQEC